MNEISKVSELKPASFDNSAVIKLTDAQSSLISLLKKKAVKMEAITRDELLDFYIKNVKGSENYRVYGRKPHPNPEIPYMIPDYDNYTDRQWREYWNIRALAITWFKTNLGACILKGKLLAIPVIEL